MRRLEARAAPLPPPPPLPGTEPWLPSTFPPIPGLAPLPHTEQTPRGRHTRLCTRPPPAPEVAGKGKGQVSGGLKSSKPAKSPHRPGTYLRVVTQDGFVESLHRVGMHLHTVGDQLDEVGHGVITDVTPCLERGAHAHTHTHTPHATWEVRPTTPCTSCVIRSAAPPPAPVAGERAIL